MDVNTTNTTAKKRIMALALALILLLLALTRATLSYFTDTKKATNTFTYGNVSIKQYEDNNDGSGWTEIPDNAGLPYTNFLPVGTASSNIDAIRGDDNYRLKAVKVTLDQNSSDAYVRTFIRVPAALLDNPILHLDIEDGYNGWTKVEYNYIYTDQSQNDTKYKVILFTQPAALSNTVGGSNESQTPLMGAYLDAKANVINGYLYHVDDSGTLHPATPTVSASEPLKIDVVTQAVQADGFETAAAAFTAAFSNKDPWDNTVPNP